MWLIENIVLRDFFPLRPNNNLSSARRASSNPNISTDLLTEAMTAVRLREDSADLRPGQSYRIYNTQDILGSLPDQHELIVQRVARWAGVEDDYVYGVVEKFERRLSRWWDRIRRQEKAGDLDGLEALDSDDDEAVGSPTSMPSR